jgi:hypothetical protein
MKEVRDWLRQVTGTEAVGPSRLASEYVSFQEWDLERRLALGFSLSDMSDVPAWERIAAMAEWVAAGRPAGAT